MSFLVHAWFVPSVLWTERLHF